THAAPQELRGERGRWKTAERRAPWHRLRTQRGPRPVESLQPVVRRASIREQAIIRSRGQGAAERPVSLFGRLCSRGHACLDVQSWGGGEANLPSRHRGRHSTPLQTISSIRYNQQNLRLP
ncbi:MAG TPA: hypothetical protein VK667_01435, partial [Ktedonobacteraceae bacterium]|nr:hypothetical protein [Ktedonobacteraceae bacterium]